MTNDFSGTKIRSTNNPCDPISVILFYNPEYFGGGHSQTYTGCCADGMMENFWPDTHWGDSFWLLPEQHVSHGNMFKVFAKSNNTEVYLNGNLIATLAADQYFDTTLYAPHLLETSEDAFVSQFFISAHTINQSGDQTDPELLFVLPNNSQSTKGHFDFNGSDYSSAMDTVWLGVLTASGNIANVLVDGVALPSNVYTPFGSDPSHSWAYVPIDNQAHSITATQGSFQGLVVANVVQGSRSYYISTDIEAVTDTNATSASDSICIYGSDLTLYAPVGDSYVWSDASTSDSLVVTQPATYWVNVYDDCGILITTDTMRVVHCDTTPPPPPPAPECNWIPEIPNVFTPNGDGVNDNFEIVHPICIVNPTLQIYNRWGRLVYKTSDLPLIWDGLINGEKASGGTYYWVFNAAVEQEEEFIQHTGYLTLIE